MTLTPTLSHGERGRKWDVAEYAPKWYLRVRDWWSRMIGSLQSATAALAAAWNQEEEDDINTRTARYELLRHWYAGTIYDPLSNPYASQYVQQNGLYAEYNEVDGVKSSLKTIRIKPVFNPCFRLVEFYVSHIYRGTLDLMEAETGAVPLITDSAALREAIIQIWKWSNWGVNLSQWTRNGSMLGDTCLYVVDDAKKGKVYLDVIEPDHVIAVEVDQFRFVQYVYFEWELEDDEGTPYTYGLEIDQTAFRTYRDGKVYAYESNTDEGGQARPEWPNPYGFVPVVLTSHLDIGEVFGLAAIAPSVKKIDDVNDLASHLGRQERKAIEPQWFLTGVTLSKTGTAGDGTTLKRGDNVWAAPNAQATAQALVEQIDINGVLADIDRRLAEIGRDLPELQAEEISAQGAQLTGRALRMLLAPAEEKVSEARKHYDADLVRAQEMAVAIAGYRGYLAGFNLDSYARGDLDHQIDPNRPIFPSDPLEDLQMQQAQLAVEMQRQSLSQQAALGTGS